MINKDRRIRKTKDVLKKSLISLMQEKSINSITVKELCETADINRGTFYLHYKDVFHMLSEIEKELFEEFQDMILSYEISPDKIETKPILKDIFTFIAKNSDFCIVILCERGDMAFMKKIVSVIYEKGYSDWSNILKKNDKDLFDKYYSFILYGAIGLIDYWLKNGLKESPEYMAMLTENIILNGLKSVNLIN
ncbi:TetR/AcrR family transcriptional regulator [Clostridium sartagoforme]|uniref:TetR/AcrR family transcriptional regulator n=1 Tax=Clostridium sartagoforme TaxID=84031 RepID=A0A4S2DFF1_9CLOT|nr:MULTISPECIES: TetR-like C-terminal domain-containing protein [Clostridium]MBS5938201.1 TetR/AcrR family transcriptional regulator C-terminal domain-containing protein [Clostridium sp.]TGY40737.1 TetR/AcrR family transcriptional regulator [Clostridium sartagoforme]